MSLIPAAAHYALVTRAAVAELIGARFGIRLQARTMGKYLARWGFTPRKPMKKACGQSPAAIKQWLDTGYPLIANRAKLEGAEIHWGDESGLRSDDVRGRSFAPKGKTRTVVVNHKRHNLSIISSVTNKGQMRRKIFLVVDNLRVHHGKPVKAWLAEHADAIEVFHLPSYSPELNTDEMANADIKQAVRTRAPARTKPQQVKATISHLRSVPRQPERVRSYSLHDPALYAA